MTSKYKKLNAIDGQFNARTIEMMESPAYRALSLSARMVIDRVCIELAHHGGNDNGKLPVTYEQFIEYGVRKDAVAPAIREAVALGFLVVTQQGCASAGEQPLAESLPIPWLNCKSIPKAMQEHKWREVPDMETAKQIARTARNITRPSRRRRLAQTVTGTATQH